MRSVSVVICAAVLLAVTSARAGAAASPEFSSFAAAVTALSGYSASIHLWEKKSADIENAIFQYQFSKPNNVSMQVVNGPNAGANVDWSGGGSVTVSKGRGLMGMFKKSVGLNDALVTSLRGYSVDDLSFGGILRHAQSVAGRTSASTATVNGKLADVVTLQVADPASDNGMTSEILYLDQATHLPLRIIGMAGNEMVRQYNFNSVVLR